MASRSEMNEVLEEHEAVARDALAAAEDTDPRAVPDVLALAQAHALLAQVAATKMAVTVLLEVRDHLREARTIGW